MKHPRRKLVPPPGGWPWLAPGFTFSIGWPMGYEVPGVSPYGELKQRTHDAGALTHTASMRAGQLQAIDVGRAALKRWPTTTAFGGACHERARPGRKGQPAEGPHPRVLPHRRQGHHADGGSPHVGIGESHAGRFMRELRDAGEVAAVNDGSKCGDGRKGQRATLYRATARLLVAHQHGAIVETAIASQPDLQRIWRRPSVEMRA